ncbi:AlpA family phage regulatory protein [Enterobacter cloacae]|nr:AlpA family phage regulatory protein [Enterobacter hormaechei]EMC9754395.1 AlpA family phage regulatory protein [Enterobacter cloacae]
MNTTLMRIEQVCFVTGFKKPTIYEWMRKGKFPRPIKIGRSARWPSCDVERWIAEKIDEIKR